jgi:hypothetical protein
VPYRSAIDTVASLHSADAFAPAHGTAPVSSIGCGSVSGEPLLWCAEDYGWTHGAAIDALFAALTVFVAAIAFLRLQRRFIAMRRPTPRARERLARFHRS